LFRLSHLRQLLQIVQRRGAERSLLVHFAALRSGMQCARQRLCGTKCAQKSLEYGAHGVATLVNDLHAIRSIFNSGSHKYSFVFKIYEEKN
jgi:hypothetical protein